MIVQIIIISIGFFIALSYPAGIEPLWSLPADWPAALAAASVILLSNVLYILIGARLVSRQINQNLRDYHRQVFTYRFLLLPVYFIQVYILHLPILIIGPDGFIGLGIGQIPFVTVFLMLTPFFLTLILSYIPFYKVERFIYQSLRDSLRSQQPNQPDKSPSLFNYLSFQIRTYFLLGALPLLCFILVFDIIHSVTPIRNAVIIYPSIEWLASILLLLVMYLVTPFALKYLWVTKPLADGPLRIYLDAIAFRANIKIRDFLIWQVGRRPFVNALLIGLFPFNRFVIFTDSLIRKLADDEIAAVFAHEVGHAKFNHLLILLLFTLAYLSILFSLSDVLESALSSGIWNSAETAIANFGFSLTMIMVFWLVLFGQLSRRFELQADWFAAEITADPDSFTRALTKIAYLNGIPMRTSGISSLTHPSIEKRITNIGNRAGFAQSQDRTMRRIIAILAIACGLGLTGIGYTIIKEIKSAPQRQAMLRAFESAEQGRLLLSEIKGKAYSDFSAGERKKLQTAFAAIDMALRTEPNRPGYYILLGRALEHLGPEYRQTSIAYYRRADELSPIDPLERYYISKKLSGQ